MWRKINKIKSKLSWSLFGNIIYALSQWGVVTIIARFGTTEDIGIYSLALAITAPIVLFFNFQLSMVLVTDSKNEFDFNQYLGSRVINSAIAFIFIFLVSFIYYNNTEIVIIILLMGLVKFVETLSDICMGYFQKKDRIDLVGKSQLYRGLLTVIIVGALFFLFRNMIIAVAGLLILMILRFIYYDLKIVNKFINIKPIFDNSWYTLIKITFPLGIVSLINSLNTNIPRYFLEHFSGIDQVGIYAALSYVLIASGMVISPVSQIVAPRLANAYNKNKVNDILIINFIVICFSIFVFSLIISSVILQGEKILTILYGSEYSKYNNIFTILNLSIFFTSLTTFFNLNIIAARKFKIQPLINFIVTIVTVLCSYYLISNNGILGAAYVLILSKGIQTLLSLLIMVNSIRKLRKV